MAALNIPILSLILVFFLLLVPFFLDRKYSLGLLRPMTDSVLRMVVQLALIGVFLKYLFHWNNTLVNIVWLMVMISVAVWTVIKDSGLRLKSILLPALVSFTAATFGVVVYLNWIVLRLDHVFDARYLVVLGGMLLGNSLRGNIVGLSSFYKSIQQDEKRFVYTLTVGATMEEAILPYLKESVRLALKPSLAAMATIGIVSLPGMMTGVILAGTDPTLAIKYQVMIMIGIIVSTVISVILTITLTQKNCFTPYGILRKDIFV